MRDVHPLPARQGERQLCKLPLPSREAEKLLRGVQPLPSRQAETQLRSVQPLPPWQAETQLRGVQPLPPRQAEKQLRGVQRLPPRQAETQLRGLQPLPSREAENSMRSRDPSVSLERARGSANRLHLVVCVCLDNRVSAMITPKSRRARRDHPSDVVRVSRIGRDKKTSRSSFGFSQCLVPTPYRNRPPVACTHLALTDCVLRADLGSGKRVERWKGQGKGFAREKAEARRRLRRGSRHPMSRDGRREKK